jgi:hypothetical protein
VHVSVGEADGDKFRHTSLTLGAGERLSILVEGVGSASTNTWDILKVDKEDARGAWVGVGLPLGQGSCIRCVAMGGEGEGDGMVGVVEDIPA